VPNPALKCLPRTVAICGAISAEIATRKMDASRIATARRVNLRADCCHRPDLAESNLLLPESGGLAIRSAFESGLPRRYSRWGIPRCWCAEFSKAVKSSSRHFTSTVPLFATPYFFFFTRDFTSVKQIHGGLFRHHVVSV
jgi:hypothetical protein